MHASEAYISSIPPEATPRQTGKHPNGRPTRIEYYLGKEQVGLRYFSWNGDLEVEYSFRNGKSHGWSFRWDNPGELLSATPYVDGVEHGTAYQWNPDGTLLGSYVMEHGTGTDLWWMVWDGEICLSEAYEMQSGFRHGHEWSFWPGNPRQLSNEYQWRQGEKHGVERNWNSRGRIERGFPRYWIHDQRVTKREYQRAAAKDETLPPFRLEDNAPERDFPPLVAASLHGPALREP